MDAIKPTDLAQIQSIAEKLDEILSLLKSEERKGWIDIKKASLYAGISISTLRRNIRRGLLKASSYQGKTLLRKADLDRWLSNG